MDDLESIPFSDDLEIDLLSDDDPWGWRPKAESIVERAREIRAKAVDGVITVTPEEYREIWDLSLEFYRAEYMGIQFAPFQETLEVRVRR